MPLVRSASVLNGSGVSGQAGQTGDGLQAAGFVVEIGDADERRTETIVRYPSALAPVAAELISLLATDPDVQVDESLENVVLITGSDFLGLAAEQRPARQLGTEPQAPSPSTTTSTSEPPGIVPEASPEGTPCG